MAPTNENAPAVTAAQGEATKQNKPAHLTPLCPRQARALAALMRDHQSRKDLDKIAGVTNSPALVAQLRRRGLEIPCTMVATHDRDWRPCKYGVYHLTQADRKAIARWQSGGWHG